MLDLNRRLLNKVTLITGAGAGIGRASALRFAAERAVVIAVDRDTAAAEETAQMVRAAGGRAEAEVADVADPRSVALLFGTVMARQPRLDVLFNNAGIVLGGTVEDTSLEEWEQTLRVNLTSMMLCCQQAVPVMKRQGGGVILNTASVAGLVGVKNRLAYSASKAGVVGLTKSIAMDFIADGIRCNCLCPGTVDSPSWRRRVAQSADPDVALRDMIARQPMGRVGTPDEIAALAAYLVSDEAAYTTGTTVFIDGGLSL
jgi:meso-butanediol dehydrogenase / (S,S)-butanediol dehydrogenase / diacetyl reductase